MKQSKPEPVPEPPKPKPKRLPETSVAEACARLSVQVDRLTSSKRAPVGKSNATSPRFSAISPRSGIDWIPPTELPASKKKRSKLPADKTERRKVIAESSERLSMPQPAHRQPTDEELGMPPKSAIIGAGKTASKNPAVIDRLVDAEKFTGTHFLRHQLVSDGGRTLGGPLGFLPPSPKATAAKASGKPKRATSRAAAKPPRICAFQLTGPCRAASRGESPTSNRGRRKLQWVEYGPGLGAGGVWACEGCESKRRASPVAALSAVLMAAGASSHARVLAAEGVTTVDRLTARSDGELRSVGIPTPAVKRLRRASGMARPSRPVRMAPASRPIIARSKRVARRKASNAATRTSSTAAAAAAAEQEAVAAAFGPAPPVRMPEDMAMLIEHTARFVATSPPFEQTVRKKRRGDRRFNFLRGGGGAKYYKSRLLFERQQLACLQSTSLTPGERSARRGLLFASNAAGVRRLGQPPNAVKHMQDRATAKEMMQNVRELSGLGFFPPGAASTPAESVATSEDESDFTESEYSAGFGPSPVPHVGESRLLHQMIRHHITSNSRQFPHPSCSVCFCAFLGSPCSVLLCSCLSRYYSGCELITRSQSNR
eukprot:SAG22_NODE_1034_length_5919_cov_5.518943_3_plen_600_part_00